MLLWSLLLIFNDDCRFRKSVISLPLHRPLYPYIRISVYMYIYTTRHLYIHIDVYMYICMAIACHGILVGG